MEPRWNLKYGENDPALPFEPGQINRQFLQWSGKKGKEAHNKFEELETYLEASGLSGEIHLWLADSGKKHTKHRSFVRGIDMPQEGRGRKVSKSGIREL